MRHVEQILGIEVTVDVLEIDLAFRIHSGCRVKVRPAKPNAKKNWLQIYKGDGKWRASTA
jgi:hypothetical protein